MYIYDAILVTTYIDIGIGHWPDTYIDIGHWPDTRDVYQHIYQICRVRKWVMAQI